MLTVYCFDGSPPCRAVYLTAKASGIDVHLKELDIFKGEQLKPDFLKLNPQHTVPILDDGGLIIVNSHAINIYLIEKYGNDDTLYPKDTEKRALVNQMLYFDEGTVFSLLFSLVVQIKIGNKIILNEKKEKAKEIYKMLETYLDDRNWVAGLQVTIADFHLITTITTLNVLIPYDETELPNIVTWVKRCQALPYYSANVKGLADFTNVMKKFLS